MKTDRKYYSIRTGKKNAEMDFNALRKIFFSVYQEFSNKAYFSEYLDDDCPDSDGGNGKIGDVSVFLLRKLRKDNLWPMHEHWESYSEEDIFDLIEFLFDHVSAPIDKDASYHSFYNHYHYKYFDREQGKKEYRDAINEILNDYGAGYELGDNGEIYALLQEEFRPLLKANIPTSDTDNVEAKIAKAVNKFRRYGSTLDERHESVRTLADCLEYLRKDLQNVITQKDDGDLFQIANNFGIRHHNDKQKTNYDRAIWLSWMFYFYLATLHAGLRLLEGNERKSKNK
ncbi:MAG: hypothetical protein PHV26_01975 [Candidatus Pacebacteria bacterium]|nr:hypothetical protein [Candidatus Paceibacterota bacterium]